MNVLILFRSLTICILLIFVFDAKAQKSLDYYLQNALKNSPIFVDNTNQIKSLTYDSLLIKALLKPQVYLNSNVYLAPNINGFGYDPAITNGGNLTALTSASYTFIRKENLDNRFSSINIQRMLIDLNSKLNERDLRQAVTSQYLMVFGQQQQLEKLNEITSLLYKEEIILKKLTAASIYRQTDYLSFLVNLKQQELIYLQQKNQIRNDVMLLNYLCGVQDTAYVNLSNPAISINIPKPLEENLAFYQYKLDSMKLMNVSDNIKYSYDPKFSIVGDAGFNSSFVSKGYKNFGASIGLNLIVPIYDGHQRQIQYDKISISDQTRKEYATFYVKQAKIKNKQIIAQIEAIELIATNAQDQFILSKKLVDANGSLLESGDLRISDFIIALSNYLASQAFLTQLNNDKLQLINQYNFLNY